MSPRFLGCKAIIARSFARIHETNLKKQGVLALTFVDPADYDRIGPKDKISVPGPRRLFPGKQVQCWVRREDGTTDPIMLKHTLTSEEIAWLECGSMLNYIKHQRENPPPPPSWLSRFWTWLTSLFSFGRR